jgi:SAM-dependent methyltransferase
MRETASDAQVAAADTYERLFVPAEFKEWAPRVLSAARVQPGQRVLDVACGTGVLAREAARIVGPSGFVAAVDADAGMLAVAARLTPDLDWRQGSATALPFADDAFDAVVSQFGLMYFPDRALAVREMMRVLRSGGRLAVAVWDTLAHTPAYADLVALLERTAGTHAADTLRAPFVLGEVDALAAICTSAGIPDATITTHVGTGRFDSIQAMVEAELKGWFPLAGVVLGDDQIEDIVRQAKNVLRRYADDDGRVAFDAPAHIMTATRTE